MHNRRESLLKILYNLALQSIKDNKKVKYKVSEIKLNHVRKTLEDLKQLKALPRNVSNPKMLLSFNERIEYLKKQEKEIIKYRLRA